MLTSNHSFKVFIDFDGTITKEDVGANIFLRYGKQPEVWDIVEQIRSRSITNSVGWEKLFETLTSMNEVELEKFVISFEIDESLKSFLELLHKNKTEHFILSDGFDFYINKILKRENIDLIPVFSNRLSFENDGRMYPEFPYKDEECTDCANCKRNHVINFSSDDEFTVYIGDGTSDICPAQHCDFIFAKDTLQRFCEQEKITFFPFSTFFDVERKMQELMSKKRLKKRHQAELKRRNVYLMG